MHHRGLALLAALGGLALALVALAAPAARAHALFGFPLRLGVYGGWHATAGDYDVLGERRVDLVPGGGPMFGARFGVRLSPLFTVEADVGFVAAALETIAADGRTTDATAWLVPAHVELQWRALDGAVTPVVGLGAGLVANVAGPGSGDSDALMTATLALELVLDDAVALRFGGGVLASDAVEGAMSWSPILTLGVDLLFWRERRADEDETPIGLVPVHTPPRRPLVAGCPRGVALALCVDSDGDGLIDAFDPCAAAAGPEGCPDPDGDRLYEPRDACPSARGVPSDWGCPR